jgi:hypothetical protein
MLVARFTQFYASVCIWSDVRYAAYNAYRINDLDVNRKIKLRKVGGRNQ